MPRNKVHLVDNLHVTAHAAVGGASADETNPLPTSEVTVTDWDNLEFTVIEATAEPLDADFACVEVAVINDSGARVLYGRVGGTGGCVVPLDDGESITLPMRNLNEIEFQSPAGAGNLDIHYVVRFVV